MSGSIYNKPKSFKLPNNRTIQSPFCWMGLSIIEDTSIQQNMFHYAKIEGILTNAYDLIYQDNKQKRHNLINSLREDGLLIKCDSGGFQLMKYGNNPNKPLTISNVLQKQLEIDGDVLVQLDIPLGIGLSDKDKYQRIDKSIENYRKVIDLNHNDKIILPVLHGHDTKMLRYGIEKIREFQSDIPICGIGSLVPMLKTVKGSASSGNKITFCKLLLNLRELLPNTFIHAFGVSGTMSYLAVQCGIDSYDSNSWIQRSSYGTIQLPGISERKLLPKKSNRPYLMNNRRLKNGHKVNEIDIFMNCECAACKGYTDFDIKKLEFDREGVDGRILRSVHNLSLYQSECNLMREHLKRGTIDRFCMSRLKNSIYYDMSRGIFEYKRGLSKFGL